MTHSDRNSGSDLLVREVIRQLADAAPPPPAWEHLTREESADEARSGRPWVQFALVAAVTAIIASGLWFIARPSDTPDVPADVPGTVRLPPVTAPSTWEAWVAATDRFDVQLCHTRVVARITSETDLAAFGDRVGDAGYTPERARRRRGRCIGDGVRFGSGSSGRDPRDVAAVAPVIGAWRTADDGYYGVDPAEPAPSFSDDVAESERRIDGYLDGAADPDVCWFERAAVMPTLAVGVDGARATIACLLSAQLSVAVDDFAAADDADDELVGSLQAAWVGYADASPVRLASMSSAVQALLEAPVEERPARAAEVHNVLEPAWASADSACAPALAGSPSTP